MIDPGPEFIAACAPTRERSARTRPSARLAGDMRRHIGPLLAALLIGGCASTTPPSPAPTTVADREPRVAARRCSDGDPDRFAWFCIVGRVLYGAAAFLQPDGLSLSVK